MHIPSCADRSTIRTIALFSAVCVAMMAWAPLCWAAEQPVPPNDTVGGEIVIAAFFGIIALGIVLGLTGRAVVFRNYDDLALVFGCGVSIVMVAILDQAHVLLLLDLLIFVGMAFAIAVRTWRDNGLLLLPVILITKIALSVLWIKHVIEAVNPNGKSMLDRSRNRGWAVLILAILTPLMARLVRDHEGFLSRRN